MRGMESKIFYFVMCNNIYHISFSFQVIVNEYAPRNAILFKADDDSKFKILMKKIAQ